MAKVSCILRHRAFNWYWLTAGQGLLSLYQVRVERECYYFFCFLTFTPVRLSSCPSLSSSLLSLLSLFSLSLGDDTKWPTRVVVSLNPNTINQSIGLGYLIYPKYSHPLLFYHILLFNKPILPRGCVQNCWMSSKQCRPWSDAALCGVWSGSTLFAQTCLCE